MLGLAARAAGLAPLDAAYAAAYESVSGPATAAVRLLSLDPFDATAVLARLAPETRRRRRAAADAATPRHRRRASTPCPPPPHPCWTSPPSSTPPGPSASSPPDQPEPTHCKTESAMHLDHSRRPSRTGTRTAPNHSAPDGSRRALRIGLGGPVGSGKTATVAALCRTLRDRCPSPWSPTTSTPARTPSSCCREAVLPPERITAVETGACPHTAIRDDISANLEAVEHLEDDPRTRSTSSSSSPAATTSPPPSPRASSTRRSSSSTWPAATTSPARAAPASPPPTSWSSTRPTSPRTSAPTWTPWPRDAKATARRPSRRLHQPHLRRRHPASRRLGHRPPHPVARRGNRMSPSAQLAAARATSDLDVPPAGAQEPAGHPDRRTRHGPDPRRAQRTRHHPPAVAQRRPLPPAAPAH